MKEVAWGIINRTLYYERVLLYRLVERREKKRKNKKKKDKE